MSKFLELVNSVYVCGSPSFEYLPKGESKHESVMINAGLLKKAGITHNEMSFAFAAIGSGVEFEMIIRRKVVSDFGINDTDKLAGISELINEYCKNQKLPPNPCLRLKISKSYWHKKYKDILVSLQDFTHEIHSRAEIKVSKVLSEENDTI